MSDVLIASTQVQDWRGPTTGVELRLALDQPITTPEGQVYGAFPTIVKRAACTISSATVNGILQYTLTIPALSLPANSNATVGSAARYSASFWRTSNNRVYSEWAGFESFTLPSAPATTTWGAISLYNGAGINPFSDQQTFSRSEILSLIDQIAGLTNSQSFTVGANSDFGSTLIDLRAGKGVDVPLLRWDGLQSRWEIGPNEAGLLEVITKGVVNAVNAVLDAGAVGDNLTDNTAAFLRAYNLAVSKGWALYIPAGIYLGQLPTIAVNDFHLFGDGKGRTVIKSSANAPVCLVTSFASNIRDIEFRGSSTGSNQHGLIQTGVTANHCWTNIYVRDTGGSGVVVTEAFSMTIRGIETDSCQGVSVDIQVGTQISLYDCYVHRVIANGIAYRFRKGIPLVINCNGIDGVISGSIWAVIGEEIAFGDTGNWACFPTFINCNVESFSAYGLQFRNGSRSNCTCVKIDGGNTLVGQIPVYFSLDISGLTDYPDRLPCGVWDENTQIVWIDSVGLFPHGKPIEASHIPPITVTGRGRPTDYYDTSTGRVESLRFADGKLGFVRVTDVSYVMQRQGGRLIHVTNLTSPTAITLIWPGWLREGDIVIVKDAANIAGTNNITITAASGSFIDGAGSKIINTNGGSVRLYSDGLNYWTF